jgi:hypothetical protein
MIVIIGDSWGVGTWGNEGNEYCLAGPGFGQYLMLHDRVINLSVGAGSNTQALNRLEELLARYQVGNDDTFYWIVTDPKRGADVEDVVDPIMGLEEKLQYILFESFNCANNLAIKYNIKIQLIGGICDLKPDWDNCYDHLKIVMPSWGQFINSNYAANIFWKVDWDQVGKLVRQRRSDLIQEWLYILELIDKKEYSMQKTFPNGDRLHPDKMAHRKLRDYFYPNYSHKY